MSIQMVSSTAGMKPARDICFGENPEQACRDAAGEGAAAFSQCLGAGSEARTGQTDCYVRTRDGEIENQSHGGSLLSRLGTAIGRLFGRIAEDVAYTPPTEATAGPTAPGAQPAEPALTPGRPIGGTA